MLTFFAIGFCFTICHYRLALQPLVSTPPLLTIKFATLESPQILQHVTLRARLHRANLQIAPNFGRPRTLGSIALEQAAQLLCQPVQTLA
jgi:hypothetical protein